MGIRGSILTIIQIAFCAFGLLCFETSKAQNQVSFRQLSVKEGLSQNSAISIVQDSTGYLWIATQDGLNKYDGKEFTVFPYSFKDITRPDYSHLGSVYSDNDGGLWMLPLDGIPYRFDVGTQTFEPVSDIDQVSVVFQDSKFNTWFGTYDNGLFLLDKKTQKPELIVPYSQINGTVYKMVESPSGELMLTTDKQIVLIHPEKFETSFLFPKTIDGVTIAENFSDIVFDKAGGQWVATFGNGLYFREQHEDVFSRISDLPFLDYLPTNLNILDLHIDTHNRLWVATYGSGLYMIDLEGNKISHFNVEKHNPRALHYKDVLCIYEDHSGTMWFGTDGAGISYYDEYLEKFNSLTIFQTPENISVDVIRAIVEADDESIWLGTSGKGLTQYDPKNNSWRTFTTGERSQGISSDRVMSLLIDEQDNLFIGTQGNGLDILSKNGKFQNYSNTTKLPLSANTIWNIFKDSKNRIWLGTREEGLIQFDKSLGEIQKFTHDPKVSASLPSNNIRIITEDSKGNLWIGTEADGIAHFNVESKTFTTYTSSAESNAISSNNIKSLYDDGKGVLWIGTNGGGLNAFDLEKQHFYTYTDADGLANNVIYAILPDDRGNLWLSSNRGLTKFTIPQNQLDVVPKVVNYDNYDGLTTEFNTGAYYRNDTGTLYFGGLEGFYWFSPDEIQENKVLPKTVITGLQVFDEGKPLSPNTIFAHDENTLSFTFSSLQYSLPEKNQYQYKLANYDTDWVHSGNTNFARYSHLAPGDYEFMVKSSNYDGVWNPETVSFKFSIASPWYLTAFAKTMYVLLFIAAAFGVYSYLKWRWRMRLDLKLKEEEAIRLQKLNDFKSKLYANISHEFRTPLTLISGPVDAKLGEGGLSDTDFTNFSMIKRNTNRLIALVDQLLHLAKLEKGKQKLKIAKGDLDLFLEMIASSFQYKAGLKKIDFKIAIAPLKNEWFDADALEKIVSNLLSNAMKYGKDGGICELEATKIDGALQLIVSNTIPGSSEIEVDKLFTRFYQHDQYAEGAGVGLALVKELVQLYQGQVDVKIDSNDMIHFKISIPLERSSLKNVAIEEDNGEANKSIVAGISDAVQLAEETTDSDAVEDLPLVLLVEDQKQVRDFLVSVWKYRYNVFEAKNGQEGIEKALEVVPDLILTDVRMPVCDGIELCNTLKTDERTSHIPIILLTAGIGEEQELKGLQSGADDFITKPFKLPILEKRVENLIETRKALRSRYSQEMVLKAKDIAITPTDAIFLNKLQDVLDEHLANPEFSPRYFCKELGMSRMQLHRKLLAFTGLSTTAFIRSQRLKQALHILQTSDATVNEVAYTVGFNTPSYFIKCFKEKYKKTPSQYLQNEAK
ncbi:MAG: two-component regulator propeller domain-containing protein [Maribacter sp.]|uniref:two-component regulator propeller domain-containing protein n=1 Tax=Maribacter sp. TaxID=1897614 RepID=UPI003297A418